MNYLTKSKTNGRHYTTSNIHYRTTDMAATNNRKGQMLILLEEV
jgi:hypothetical protein